MRRPSRSNSLAVARFIQDHVSQAVAAAGVTLVLARAGSGPAPRRSSLRLCGFQQHRQRLADQTVQPRSLSLQVDIRRCQQRGAETVSSSRRARAAGLLQQGARPGAGSRCGWRAHSARLLSDSARLGSSRSDTCSRADRGHLANRRRPCAAAPAPATPRWRLLLTPPQAVLCLATSARRSSNGSMQCHRAAQGQPARSTACPGPPATVTVAP